MACFPQGNVLLSVGNLLSLFSSFSSFLKTAQLTDKDTRRSEEKFPKRYFNSGGLMKVHRYNVDK
jgi:hypothetical protein